jgi:putative acetyltransferase
VLRRSKSTLAGVWRTSSGGRLVLVAVDEDDRPVAYIDLEADGHIDHLFCRPDLAGTGVAAMLHDRLEAEAAARGIRILHVRSERARPPLLPATGLLDGQAPRFRDPGRADPQFRDGETAA